MTPVIPCSSGTVTLLTKATFSQRKDIPFAKYNVSQRSSRAQFLNHRSLPLSILPKYFGDCCSKHFSRTCCLAAVGADVATEEPNSATLPDQADTLPKILPASLKAETDESSAVSTSATSTAQSKQSRTRKSDMPPVKNEELIPGASFTGKVRSIQPFGAFVEFGAFTDGLVHVSKLSNEFVKEVGDVVSVGQEVQVRIVDANMETGRISLTMRDSDDVSKSKQRTDASGSSDGYKTRTPRKNDARSNQKRDNPQKTTKFVKGQVLNGTVKNITRSGAYVSLPEGEEGFLPLSEESEGFGNILGSSSLQIGQEVNVRVLRISRGQVTLTMKKEEDIESINLKLNQGVVHTATNPFVLAFRKNKDIAAFLDQREKAQESMEASKQLEETVNESLSKESDQPELLNTISSTDEEISDPTSVDPLEKATIVDSASAKVVTDMGSSEILSSEGSDSSTGSSIPETSPAESEKPDSSTQVAKDGDDDETSSSSLDSQEIISSSDLPISEAFIATEIILNDNNTTSGSNSAADSSPGTDVEKEETGSATEITDEVEANIGSLISEGTGSLTVSVTDGILATDSSDGNTCESECSEEVNDAVIASDSTGEEMVTTQSGNDAPAPVETELTPLTPTNQALVSPALVKQLREETGAGMMDCKKALLKTGGDIIKAQEILRKKGLASADKKASRATTEGRIGSYIHDNRIGVLIEVNCETDFVSRGDIFKELVDDLAMQVAACPQVQYLVTEDVPEETVGKEREIEMQKEDLLTKPEQIRSKIVDGRIRKRLEELALLEQPYIKNDKMIVKDLVKQTIATIGENIKIKRFARYNLGEGLQKKSQDFAAEVAAQTTLKEPPAVPNDQPTEAEETFEKPLAVTISAALVKQLREDTGAGMMDCKKALTETGGDLEKAQEYLRKKGLSSADKKSSRLASEGRISTYIHDNRIGVLIEVNCETDFVARNERFKELADDLAMQVAACPQVEFVSMEEIPESVFSKEKELEMQREDLQSKPENIREKIVEGRVSKRLGELALLEQPFIKDDSLLVKDLVKQTVAALGENIRVRRFIRFNLGE